MKTGPTTLRTSSLLLLALTLLLGSCDFMWPKYNACHTGQCGDAATGADMDARATDSTPDADGTLTDQAPDGDGSGGDKSLAPSAWAVAAGSPCGSGDAGAAGCVDSGQAIAVDKNGNLLVAGSFQGVVTFGSTTLSATGATSDLFVAELDPSGQFLWATAAASKGNLSARGVALDSSGDAFITGTLNGSATLGTTTLTAAKIGDMFAAKLDGSTGKFVWATAAEADDAEGAGIATGPKGHPHVTGSFKGNAKFGQKVLLAANNWDVFVAKLDSATGKFTWVAQGGGSMEDRAVAIAVEAKGHAYITGKFGKVASFGIMTVKSAALSDVFVAKLDPAGKFVWAYGSGKASLAAGTGIAVDAIGNAYVTGTFRVSTQFGTTALKTKAYTDFFATKIDVAGNFIWAASGGASCGAASDAGSSSCEAYSTGIAMGLGGDVLVTGKYKGSLLPGPLVSSGKHDVFVTRINSTGGLTGGVSGGGKDADSAQGIASDSQGNAYITGSFSQSGEFGSTTLSSGGLADIFVWKVKP